MVKHMATKDMTAFMAYYCIQFVIIEHLDQTRSDGDEYFGVAKCICIRHRVHLKVELRLFNPELLTYWRKVMIKFWKLRFGKTNAFGHVCAVEQTLIAERIELLYESREPGYGLKLSQSSGILGMYEV